MTYIDVLPSPLPVEAHDALTAQGWEYIPAGYRKNGLAFNPGKGPVPVSVEVDADLLSHVPDVVGFAEGEFTAAVTAIEEKADGEPT